jgi:signal transduction histidine kinase
MLFNSLASRLIGSLLAVLITAQLISVIVFANRQEDNETHQRERQLLQQVAMAENVLTDLPIEKRRDALRQFNRGGELYALDFVTSIPSPEAATGDELAYFERTNVALSDVRIKRFADPRTLWDRFVDMRMFPDPTSPPPRRRGDRPPPPRRVIDADDPLRPPPPDPQGFAPPRPGQPGGPPAPPEGPRQMQVSIPITGGQWINAMIFWPDKPPPWMMPLLAQLVISLTGIAIVVFFLVRHNTKGLNTLAVTADRIGRGEEFTELKEEGPREIKATIGAFNSMAARIKRMVHGRTRMLAAISHDLRTPITSLRIRAEMLPDNETRERMLATLDEMQSLTEATLTLARQDAVEEDTSTVDLSALVETVCDDLADVGKPVSFAPAERLLYRCRPNNLKRCVRNIVENAIKYGVKADVSIATDKNGVIIYVDDHGPGIPESQMKRLFQAFVRLEESRSKETGGFGLGLSIARSIAHSHGGEVTLANRPEGGLRATIMLPPAQLD